VRRTGETLLDRQLQCDGKRDSTSRRPPYAAGGRAGAYAAAAVQDHPADLVNIAIEELVRQRCELPAFSTLDRLVQRVRTLVHARLFRLVLKELSINDQQLLDGLLESEPPRRSMFDALKQPPPRPSLSHRDELVSHLRWLEMFGDKSHVLAGHTPAKVRHFAAEAQVLDAAELKDITEPKRYTLVLCLIHRAQIQARDDLADMFLKRAARFHAQAQQELELIRAQHRALTEELIDTLADMLSIVESNPSDAELGRQVKSAVARHGRGQRAAGRVSRDRRLQ
jgi:hypothetical protein